MTPPYSGDKLPFIMSIESLKGELSNLGNRLIEEGHVVVGVRVRAMGRSLRNNDVVNPKSVIKTNISPDRQPKPVGDVISDNSPVI